MCVLVEEKYSNVQTFKGAKDMLVHPYNTLTCLLGSIGFYNMKGKKEHKMYVFNTFQIILNELIFLENIMILVIILTRSCIVRDLPCYFF